MHSSIFFRIGFTLFVVSIAAVVRCYREIRAHKWHWTSQGLMAFVLLCLAGGHLAGGRIGWLDRYEDYVMLGTALLGIYVLQEKLRSCLTNQKRGIAYSCGVAAALLLLCWHYVSSIRKIPIAANNIYEQQLQMHRFVTDYYRGPVAVNDLGLVSYHDPNFVLDLGGLASNEARILFMNHAGPSAYRSMVDKNRVQLVIIYDEWFKNRIPAGWIKVASMDLSRERVSADEKEVQFYATDSPTAGKLLSELEVFKTSLPPRVRLTIYNSRTPGA